MDIMWDAVWVKTDHFLTSCLGGGYEMFIFPRKQMSGVLICKLGFARIYDAFKVHRLADVV